MHSHNESIICKFEGISRCNGTGCLGSPNGDEWHDDTEHRRVYRHPCLVITRRSNCSLPAEYCSLTWSIHCCREAVRQLRPICDPVVGQRVERCANVPVRLSHKKSPALPAMFS